MGRFFGGLVAVIIGAILAIWGGIVATPHITVLVVVGAIVGFIGLLIWFGVDALDFLDDLF